MSAEEYFDGAEPSGDINWIDRLTTGEENYSPPREGSCEKIRSGEW
jgi:hypothetical protein